jgi:hypothetical protein
MTFATTSVFYLTFGVGVAAALLLRRPERPAARPIFRSAAAILFWPLFIPLLLEQAGEQVRGLESSRTAVCDSLARAISQVESELDGALGSLDGWAEGVLVDERQRLEELRSAWRSQAERVRELDRFLAQPDATAAANAPSPLAGLGASSNERRQKSEQARLENMRRLRVLRQRMLEDLLATLAWVRELSTMIHLAKFSGAPASRAEELVSQIAAAVEGLKEASSWSEPLSGDTVSIDTVSIDTVPNETVLSDTVLNETAPHESVRDPSPRLREPGRRASSNPPALDRVQRRSALLPSGGST